jgi:hypothetical protein
VLPNIKPLEFFLATSPEAGSDSCDPEQYQCGNSYPGNQRYNIDYLQDQLAPVPIDKTAIPVSAVDVNIPILGPTIHAAMR